jgi:hypothetical protein
MRIILIMIGVMVFGLIVGAKLAGAGDRVSYFDTATCSDYLSVSRTDRIHRSREIFRVALTNPGYIRVQLECAQNPSMLRRMEASIERMCKGREDYLVRNAYYSALNAHKSTCNWR